MGYKGLIMGVEMENSGEKLEIKAVKSTIAKLVEKILTLGLQFIVSIVLARLLAPSDYGVIALISVFIVISNVFIDYGFGVGLVQKKDVSPKDINTIFISSLATSLVFYGIVFLISPFVAKFYEEPLISSVLRFYSITIVIGSLISIPNSLLSRNLKHAKLIIPTIVSCIISGIVGIMLAINGFGVWALVAQQLSQKIVYLIIIECVVKYIPRLEFSYSSFKSIISYTWKIVLTNLIAAIFDQCVNLIIGKKYDSEQLGYYNKGNQLPSTIITAVDTSVSTVMFSVFSKKQNSIEDIKAMLRRTIRLNLFFTVPIMLGLIAVSEPLVVVVLTEKWLPSVVFMRIVCIALCLHPFISLNEQAINSIGKSMVTLKVEIIKRVFSAVVIFVSLFISVEAIAWSVVIINAFSCLIYCVVSNVIIHYSFREQAKDLLPIVIAGVVMLLVVMCMNYLDFNNFFLLVLEVLTGVIIYFVSSLLLKSEPLFNLLSFLKKKKQ